MNGTNEKTTEPTEQNQASTEGTIERTKRVSNGKNATDERKIEGRQELTRRTDKRAKEGSNAQQSAAASLTNAR